MLDLKLKLEELHHRRGNRLPQNTPDMFTLDFLFPAECRNHRYTKRNLDTVMEAGPRSSLRKLLSGA